MKVMVMKMTDRKEENLEQVCNFMPPKLSVPLLAIGKEKMHRLCEIRLRSEKPVVLIFTDERLFITKSGRLTSFVSNDLLSLSQDETEAVFNSMCRYSVHSLSHEIAEGFITVDGGNRVGVYGTAVTDGKEVTSVRNIKGLNIRISGDFKGVAEPVYKTAFDGRLSNVLICGPPSTGKTTVLKDLCRSVSDEMGRKICVIDERMETDGCDMGINTDVLSGYPKPKGIEISVRTLSPELVAFDELGSTDEVQAVCSGLNSGVNFIMTLHCHNKTELLKKPQFIQLKSYDAVDYIVFLENAGEISEILSIEELENENCGADRTGTCLRPVGSVHSLRA